MRRRTQKRQWRRGQDAERQRARRLFDKGPARQFLISLAAERDRQAWKEMWTRLGDEAQSAIVDSRLSLSPWLFIARPSSDEGGQTMSYFSRLTGV